jgi:ABC-type phosphate transport system permease subunit
MLDQWLFVLVLSFFIIGGWLFVMAYLTFATVLFVIGAFLLRRWIDKDAEPSLQGLPIPLFIYAIVAIIALVLALPVTLISI